MSWKHKISIFMSSRHIYCPLEVQNRCAHARRGFLFLQNKTFYFLKTHNLDFCVLKTQNLDFMSSRHIYCPLRVRNWCAHARRGFFSPKIATLHFLNTQYTVEAPKSWTRLSYNWFLGEKHQFYCVFLKVRAPGAVICSNLERSLARRWPARTTGPLPTPPEPLQC